MNILDYLDWRGDLSFAASPPNEVDALIFSWLIYYRFEDLGDRIREGMTLEELDTLHEEVYGPLQEVNLNTTINPVLTSAWLLHRAGAVKRFAGVKVSRFLERQNLETSEEGQKQEMQFAAVTFILQDAEGELSVIAFRGTDDSIAGWKEDFYLAFSEQVPVQQTALSYLEEAPKNTRIWTCGHSKGGNLAVYAALFAAEERMKNTEAVYNFDGPGFCFDIQNLESYQSLRDRITTIVPESSIVGMLLEHEDDYQVVESKGMGLLQHDALFWQVLGSRFVPADKRNGSSLIADRALRGWLNEMSVQERREFVDVIFGILEGTGAVRTTELPEKLTRDGFRNIIHAPISTQEKKLVFHVLRKLIKAGNSSLYESLRSWDF